MTMPLVIGASQQKRSGRPFIIKVNYASGFTVTLPLYNAGGYNYNFIVDWGDGAVGQVTSATDSNRIHTYASGGTYTIVMTGTLEGWTGNATGLKEYITEVIQWGRTGFKSVSMYNCSRLTACYGKIITSQTTLSFFFSGCTSLTTVDVSGWDVSKVTNFGTAWGNGMFNSCSKLTSLDCSTWVFNSTSNITFSCVFGGCSVLTTIGDTSGWNTSKFTNLYACFYADTKISSLDTSNWDTSSLTSLQQTFWNCSSLTTLDTSNWVVSKVTNFNAAFSGCVSLISLDVSGWVFSSISNIDLSSMFNGCSSITSLDVSAWNTGKVTNMSRLFSGDTKLASLDVSLWDTSSVTNLSSTFSGCTSLTTLDVSGWDVSKVTNFGTTYSNGTFGGCSKLTSLDCSTWVFNSTSNITLCGVFWTCKSLTTVGDVSGWNINKVTSLAFLFNGCNNLLSLDVSNWDTSLVNSTVYMFESCYLLTSIDISGWDMSNVTDNIWMFKNCRALTFLTLPSSLSIVKDQFANFNTLTPAITVYNIYRATAPTVSGTPFGNYAKPLHVPVSNSGYDVAPWTNTAIFSSIINDL